MHNCVLLYHEFYRTDQGIAYRSYTDDDQDDSEDLSARPQKEDLTVSNSSQGDDNHVEGVQEILVLYDHIAQSSDYDHQHQQDEGLLQGL